MTKELTADKLYAILKETQEKKDITSTPGLRK